MNREEEQTSRRDFVKQGVQAAAASIVAGVGANTALGAGREHKKITFRDALPTRKLGKTGVALPMLGYGGAALPKKWHNNLSYGDRIKLVRYAYDSGIRYFDTSISYSYAESQDIIGRALKDVRDNAFITTKVDFWDVSKPDGRITRIPKGETLRQVEMNLKELKSDYIDAILIHGTPGVQQMTVEQCMEVHGELVKAREKGLVRFVGFSAHGYFDKALALIESGGFDLCMLSYGYIPRGHDQVFSERMLRLREACLAKAHELKMGIAAMKVVGAGMMGGWAPYLVPGTEKKVVQDLPGAAIRWVLDDERIDLLVVGMRIKRDIDQNIRTLAQNTACTAEDRALLETFSTRAMKSEAIRKMKVE